MVTTQTLSAGRVRAAVGGVPDPEIPTVTIADLGIVERIEVRDDAIEIDLLPTFSGCPALDVIKEDVERAVEAMAGDRSVLVRFVYNPPWTTDRVTPEGRAALAGFGIAPPGARGLPLLQIAVACPYCGSRDTTIESEFGPTLCRTIRYCASCRNPFEGFKPK